MKNSKLAIGLLAPLLLGAVATVAIIAPARAQSLVTASGDPISLEVGKGTLISLPRDANTIFVANPSVADIQVKTPRLIFLYGKNTGGTSIYAVDAQHKMILSRPILVSRDLSGLEDELAQLDPNGSVKVKSIGSSLVLTGTVSSAVDVDEIKRMATSYTGSDGQLIDRLQVDAPNQVNLRVRIAEVDHTVIKDLGLNWDTLLHPGSFVFGIANGSQVLASSTSGETPGSASGITSILDRNNGPNSIIAGFNSGGTLIDSVIDALDSNGLINTLAEPNLTTTSGETASFLAGGEFPIVVPSVGVNATDTIEYKTYGVSLSFTPVILADGRISMRVAPEVSELSTQGAIEISGFSIPALTTRRAETTVELSSGQTFAIGGLLQDTYNNAGSQLPGLGNLPVLGPLFRSTQFQHNQSELVILVTPYLVRPSSGKLSDPTQGYTPPTDAELLIGGKDAHAAQAASLATPTNAGGNSLIGPAGFILN